MSADLKDLPENISRAVILSRSLLTPTSNALSCRLPSTPELPNGLRKLSKTAVLPLRSKKSPTTIKT